MALGASTSGAWATAAQSSTSCACSAAPTAAAATRCEHPRRERGTEQRRQAIARDLGFAETVFIDDPERAELRIFTPTVKLQLAGHPMVGTA